MLSLEKKQYYLVGISYKKADITTRGKFSLSENQQIELLNSLKEDGYSSIVVLSTCNRTEISGVVECPYTLINKLCSLTNTNINDFLEVSYILKTDEAINHLYRMVTGLDSQILGDYEILGQLKKAVSLSKRTNGLDTFTERLFNSLVKTSKKVKNETFISSGVTSVAYAAIRHLKNNVKNINSKKILIIGAGEIGKNSLKNILSYTENKNVTIINRTFENAKILADKFNINKTEYSNLKKEITKSDIIIVATSSDNTILNKEHLDKDKEIHIIDLSVPRNVDTNIDNMSNKFVLDLDCLSKQITETQSNREKEIPKVNTIIEYEKQEFIKWLEARKLAPVIHKFKEKLNKFQSDEINFYKKKSKNFDKQEIEIVSNRINQKIIRHFATYLHTNIDNADSCISLVNDMFKLDLTNEQ